VVSRCWDIGKYKRLIVATHILSVEIKHCSCEILGSHGGEREDGCRLGFCVL
jgi:hypothetical protein